LDARSSACNPIHRPASDSKFFLFLLLRPHNDPGFARTSHPYDALLDPELSLGQMRPRNPNTRIGIEYACDAVVRKTDLKHDAKCLGGTKRLRFPPCFVSPGSTELDLTPSSRPAQYRPSRSYFRFKPGDYFRKNLRLTQLPRNFKQSIQAPVTFSIFNEDRLGICEVPAFVRPKSSPQPKPSAGRPVVNDHQEPLGTMALHCRETILRYRSPNRAWQAWSASPRSVSSPATASWPRSP